MSIVVVVILGIIGFVMVSRGRFCEEASISVCGIDLVPKEMNCANAAHWESKIEGLRELAKIDPRFEGEIKELQAKIDRYNRLYGCKKYRVHVGTPVRSWHIPDYKTLGYLYCDTIEEIVDVAKKLTSFDGLKNYPNVEKAIATGYYDPRDRYIFSVVESDRTPDMEYYYD